MHVDLRSRRRLEPTVLATQALVGRWARRARENPMAKPTKTRRRRSHSAAAHRQHWSPVGSPQGCTFRKGMRTWSALLPCGSSSTLSARTSGRDMCETR